VHQLSNRQVQQSQLHHDVSLSKCQWSPVGSLAVTATDAGIVSIFVTPSLLSDSDLASIFVSADGCSSLTSVVSCFCGSPDASVTHETSLLQRLYVCLFAFLNNYQLSLMNPHDALQRQTCCKQRWMLSVINHWAQTKLTTLATVDVFELQWSKVADFNLPNRNLAHLLGMTHLSFAEIFSIKKIEVPELSCGIVCMILHLAVSRFSRTATCDSQTHEDDIYHASMASRSTNHMYELQEILCMLPVSVARSFFDDNAIHYVLPVCERHHVCS